MRKLFENMKFDVIVGNPPYQGEPLKNGGALPLYHKFIEKSIEISNQYVCLVTPSRWFSGGTGLDGFRKMMQNRTDIRFIKHFDSTQDIFPTVKIDSGISYSLLDKKYSGECKFNGVNIRLNQFDMILDPKKQSIINKISNHNGIDSICKLNNFGILKNDIRLKKDRKSPNDVICYISQKRGLVSYIDKKEIKNNNEIDMWKVITPGINGSIGFGNIHILNPGDVCDELYCCFNFTNEKICYNFKNYIQSKFVTFLLDSRRMSQVIPKSSMKWIPLLDFTQEWTDEKLYKHFGLDDNEIALIEEYYKK